MTATLEQQYRAILLTKEDLEKELSTIKESGLKVYGIRMRIEVLLDAAETIRKLMTFVEDVTYNDI